MDFDQRIIELGLQLPVASSPQGNYANVVQTGNLLFVSGKGPVAGLAEVPEGKLGERYSVEEGYQFARLTGWAPLNNYHLPQRVKKCAKFEASSAGNIYYLGKGLALKLEVKKLSETKSHIDANTIEQA